jgi:two-component system, NtrC family, sensor histidine kinase PilS
MTENLLDGGRHTHVTPKKLLWLVAGRLAVAFILLFSSGLWGHGNSGSIQYGFQIIVAVICFLTFLYACTFRLLENYDIQARVQVSIDVLLVTCIVWMTGDASSPYSALYMIVIATAGILLSARDALVTSVMASTTYTLVTVSIVLGVLQPFSVNAIEVPISELIHKIGLNDVGFFVVGLLAAQLANRQATSDVRLQAATTELTKLRALHERIIESMRSGVVTTDIQHRIFTFNSAAEELTGYRASEVRAKDLSFLFGELSDKIEVSLRAAAAGETSPRFEHDCLTPDGTRLRLGFTIFPLISESGERTGLVITFQDITEMSAHEEVSRRQDRLAAVGRMAAGIAHEIRNPLASMRGSIQVLRSEIDSDSEAFELMDIILKESDRLNNIITDFLRFARPRNSELQLLDLREPLRDTIALLRNSSETLENHEIIEQLPEQPVMISADSSQLRQVFWNLARNALKAMPDGGRLTVSAEATEYGGIRILFSDNGIGMAREQIERLFEPFSSTSPGSTGLGLSIVYQIVREHGGTISVHSRESEGTTIKVELPTTSEKEFAAHFLV